MIVMDCFALPVEGTETRVNAQAQAYEYMAAYTESAKQVLCNMSGIEINFMTGSQSGCLDKNPGSPVANLAARTFV